MAATIFDQPRLAAPGQSRKLASGPSCRTVGASRPSRSRLRTSTGLLCGRHREHTSDVVVARYYDPSTAQFLTRDPLEDETGQPYSYADDDPIDNSDPSGDFCIGSICTRFDPGAGLDALVNIGRGATFGLTDKIDDWISPGSSCTVAQNGVDQFLGGAATSLIFAGGTTGLARLAALRLPYTAVDGLIATEDALGVTDEAGNIFVDSSLEGQELRQTLLHEAVHSIYSRLAPGLAASTYQFAAGKFVEEFIAETFATGNPIGAFGLASTY